MRKINIPIFVSHMGCMHACVFCNQKRITGMGGSVTPAQADEMIQRAVKTIDKGNARTEIAFFGGSFTAIDIDEQEALLKVANKYIKSGDVCGIRLSTRPDCIDEKELALLKKYGVTSIELGVQSTDSHVLEISRRGHTYDDVVRASRLIKSWGFELGLQMMLGLPGDTAQKSLQTARDIISLCPDTARIYPTLVICDSALADMYERGEYVPLSLDEAVGLCAQIYEMFKESGIEVLRMGLMASEDLCGGRGIIAGPFHPSFGELVLSKIFLRREKMMIEEHMAEKNCGGEVLFLVNPRDLSKAVGNRRKNIIALESEYNVKIEIKCGENVERGKILWYNKNE